MCSYLYGVKVHMISTTAGVPVEIHLVPGGEHDVKLLERIDFNLKPKSVVYTDSVYTSYTIEDQLMEIEGVIPKLDRKKNSKKKRSILYSIYQILHKEKA